MSHVLAVLALALACAPALAQPRVDLLNPDTLSLLDQPGDYSFATVLGLADAEREFTRESAAEVGMRRLKYLRLNELARLSTTQYKPIADLIRSDIEELIAKSGERMAYSTEQAETMAKDGKVPRHFDFYWLTSGQAAFPLVAVVNRIDKRDFYADTCGEVRLIYRLSYYRAEILQNIEVESRSTLPLFLNVVFDYPLGADASCADVARLWTSEAVTKPADAAALIRAMKEGPLAKSRLRLKQIELNMQAVRYPSELKNDFGGQAVYLMRIFRDLGEKMTPIPLENTLNVAAISQSRSLRDALIAQIQNPENLKKIDNGTFVLENTNGELLATRALSFTTVGRARLGNKPFSAVFGANGEGLKDVDIRGLKFVKSTLGLVERLNNTSCMGCHQTGGTAGFHLLGRAGALNTAFNQVILPFSPHYLAERTRRSGYIEALAKSQAANTFRPMSFYPVASGSDASGLPTYRASRKREACLSRAQTEFGVTLACAAGTACKLTAKNEAGGLNIGECVETPNVTAGNVCRRGIITSAPIRPELGDLYNLFAIKDKMDASETFNDQGGCTVPEQGVPLGRISRRCQADSDAGRLKIVDAMKTAADKPKEMCVIQGGDVFDDCAKSSNPPECLVQAAATIARAFLDTCSAQDPCREDYICQQLPREVSMQYQGETRKLVDARIAKLQSLGVGFCVPNYFVFNMRADGHILPEGRIEQIQKGN